MKQRQDTKDKTRKKCIKETASYTTFTLSAERQYEKKDGLWRILFLGLILLFSFPRSQAQEVSEVYLTSDTLQVYFRQDKINLEPRFRNNGKRLLEFSRLFNRLLYDPQSKVRSILIVSGASPEGASTHNRYLSDNRAQVVYDYLVDHHLVDADHIEIESRGVDWKGLEARVRASNLPYKEEVLQILALPEWISKDGKVVDGRKHRLMNYQGGKVWQELYDLYFADLRGTRVMIAYNIQKDTMQQVHRTDTVYVHKTDTVYRGGDVNNIIQIMPVVVVPMGEVSAGRSPVQEVPDDTPSDNPNPFRMVIKTNLLYDAAIIPNIGAEVGIYKGLALSGYYQNIWLRNKTLTRWYRLEGFEAGLKWYINKAKRPFKGHHVELYGQMLTWDFTYNGRGYLAERWAYGGGLSYGYAARIGRRFNLDFEIGIGYLSGDMHEYIPQDGHRFWQSLEPFHWIGPTKIGVTLQWLVGRGNYNERRVKKR